MFFEKTKFKGTHQKIMPSRAGSILAVNGELSVYIE